MNVFVCTCVRVCSYCVLRMYLRSACTQNSRTQELRKALNTFSSTKRTIIKKAVLHMVSIFKAVKQLSFLGRIDDNGLVVEDEQVTRTCMLFYSIHCYNTQICDAVFGQGD